MKCPKCESENVTINVVNEVKVKKKRHGAAWWIFLGWYWVPCKWLFFTIPALIIKLIRGKREKVENIQKTVCCCQACGHTWENK